VRDYPVLAASGGPGPKLRQGDLQVPEGFYKILWLNPMSSYHLSMKLDYPNAFDRAQAAREGRTQLGGDIFIHGRDVSIGCLALGDPAIEELFVLVNDVGVGRVRVLIAPHDLRRHPRPTPAAPAWLDGLYVRLERELRRYPRAAS
jgi:murein L,D-transpeptidase YafK